MTKLLNINGKMITLNSILIGIMLGDGSLYKSSHTSNTRLEMSFGEKYESFAKYLGELFKEYMNNPVKSVNIKGKEKVLGAFGENYRLKTKSLPLFNPYYNMFYSVDPITGASKKIVPLNISELMDPVVLAYLIMTDGNFDKPRNRVRIYTNSFQKEEVENLAFYIQSNLGIYTGVLYDRKNQWILTIGAKQLKNLREIVSPYFHETLLYRIGL